MSPQFVDFDADGRLDIVAGIFDGSPHLVRGTAQGWAAPEQILDSEGDRIVLNAFWDFDKKQWDETHLYDAPGHEGKAHMTSAVAFDWDGDGDLDLLLGDHNSGRVFRRMNEGTAASPQFSLENEVVEAAGKPIDVPGTVATLRVVDWNGDGRLDLACGGMGDAYNVDVGGGVYVYLNQGTPEAPRFAAPLTLLERSKKEAHEPTRPDSGLYMDFGDVDGDGDLDLLVGGYSHWKARARALSKEESARVPELQAQIDANNAAKTPLYEQRAAATAAQDAEALARLKAQISALNKEGQELAAALDALIPRAKREPFVWLYINEGARTGAATAR
ncbi:MAG: FG-GAP-like repeat-containing protein [Planctomycetota bacterium]